MDLKGRTEPLVLHRFISRSLKSWSVVSWWSPMPVHCHQESPVWGAVKKDTLVGGPGAEPLSGWQLRAACPPLWSGEMSLAFQLQPEKLVFTHQWKGAVCSLSSGGADRRRKGPIPGPWLVQAPDPHSLMKMLMAMQLCSPSWTGGPRACWWTYDSRSVFLRAGPAGRDAGPAGGAGWASPWSAVCGERPRCRNGGHAPCLRLSPVSPGSPA